MREQLKNELLLMLDKYCDNTTLPLISQKLEVILSNYDIKSESREIVPYEYEIPETVKIYIVTKKIAGKSEKSLYLYSIVLKDFFITVQKQNHEITANDIRLYLYNYQNKHGISNRTLDSRRTIICTYFGWIASEGYIDKNPALNVAPIKYERIHKKAMSQLDLEKIRNACKTKREKLLLKYYIVQVVVLVSWNISIYQMLILKLKRLSFLAKEVSIG